MKTGTAISNLPAVFVCWVGFFSVELAVNGFAQQNPQEVKQRILAQAKTIGADDYAFTRTIRSESSGARTEQKVTIEKFDPTKPAAARWTLVSVNGASPAADELT